MRTNIELNDDLLAQAREYSKSQSKRAVVEEALATYVSLKKDEKKRVTYRDRLDEIRLKTASLRLKSSAQDIIRNDRERL